MKVRSGGPSTRSSGSPGSGPVRRARSWPTTRAFPPRSAGGTRTPTGADSAQVAGPDLPPPKVAAPDPDVEERGAIPGPGADGDQHDGLQDGPSPAREGERRGPVSPRLDEEPGPRPFHR